MATEELKTLPCPFCGGTECEISVDEDSQIFLYCLGCHALVRGDEASSEDADQDRNGVNLEERNSVRELWNKRWPTEKEREVATLLFRLKHCNQALKAIAELPVGKDCNCANADEFVRWAKNFAKSRICMKEFEIKEPCCGESLDGGHAPDCENHPVNLEAQP